MKIVINKFTLTHWKIYVSTEIDVDKTCDVIYFGIFEIRFNWR